MSIVALAAKRCQPTSPNSIVAWSPEEEIAAATALRKELSLARSHQCRRLFVEREKRVSQERQARLALEEALARHEATTAERDAARKKAADAATLAAKGVGTTTFLMNSNEMNALRGTRADEDGLYASNSSAKIMTVVAYTATKATPPRVARIEANEPSNASGRSGRVSGLTMLVTLEKGNVKYLRWHDRGCGECGGAASARCVDVGEGQRSCAASMEGCDGTCTGTTCDVELGTVDALR